MQRPARAVTVPARHPERVVLGSEVAQQVPAPVIEVGKGADTEPAQWVLSRLPFDAPDVLLLAPQRKEPGLAALLLDFGDLVVDPQYHVALAQGESLNLAVFAVLAIFAGEADEGVLVKIQRRQVIVKAEIHSRQCLGFHRKESDALGPLQEALLESSYPLPPQRFAAKGDVERRVVELAEGNRVIEVADHQGIARCGPGGAQQKLRFANPDRLRL